jgi:erythromycin esterase-like protein
MRFSGWSAALAAVLACGGSVASAPSSMGSGDDAGAPPPSADAGDAANTSEAGDAADSGLPQGVYPLATSDQTAPYDDLAPLLAMVGSTANVGIGESIHTSGGFEAMKARIVRYLVDKGGFRVVAIESPRTAAANVTGKYVATCAGTPTQAASGIFGVFAADTTRDLLAWLCAFNQSHPGDTVQFVGFDVQQAWTDWDALRTWLAQAAPADAASLTGPLMACDGPQATSEADYAQNHFNDPYDAAHFASCGQALDALDAYIAANQAAMTQRTSAEAYTLGKLSALGLRSWQGEKYYYTTDTLKSFEARDLAMAPVYEMLRSLYFPQKKALLWAHNYHLMRSHPAASDPQGVPGARNMGSVLAQDLGDAYAPIGLSGWDVEINWPGTGHGPTSTPSSSSEVEWKLHHLNQPLLLVDLHDPGLAPFLTPSATYGCGNPWSMGMVPADQWRAVVYFESSPPMNALFW